MGKGKNQFPGFPDGWGCESPIEQMFLHAWLSLLAEDGRREGAASLSEILKLPSSEPRTILHPESVDFTLVQEEIESFRADFVLARVQSDLSPNFDDDGMPLGEIMRKLPLIVVECDGHDFHEKTKEQAQRDKARDRRLSLLGFGVLRFTGSEIYRDPARCAREADALFNSMFFGHAGASLLEKTKD